MQVVWLLLFLVLPNSLSAQGRKPAATETPFASESGENFAFRCLEDDHGGFYLVWPRQKDATVTLIGQHIDAEGKRLWTKSGAPLAGELGAVALWDAQADGQGGLLLTWESSGPLRAQRYDPETAKPLWPLNNEAVTPSTSSQIRPALAADGAGGAYIVWQEKTPQARWVLMAQHINALGAALWTAGGTRVSLLASDQQRPRVVYDGAIGLVVAWNDSRDRASQLQAQRMNYQGNRLWGAQGIIVTAPGNTTKPPFLAAGGAGNAVLAWQMSSAAADRIFLQRVDADGRLNWNPRGTEVSLGAWHQWNPVLHGDGQGGTWVGWEDYRDQNNWNVFVQHFKLDGKAAWPHKEVPLSTVRSPQGRLAITDNGRKGVLAVWVDNRYGAPAIYLQEVTENGQAAWDLEGFKVADRLADPLPPQIVSPALGQAIVSWAYSPSKGSWSLYWKRVVLKS